MKHSTSRAGSEQHQFEARIQEDKQLASNELVYSFMGAYCAYAEGHKLDSIQAQSLQSLAACEQNSCGHNTTVCVLVQ